MALMPDPCQIAPATARRLRRLQSPGRFYAGVRGFWQVAFGAAMKVRAGGLDHTELQGGVLLAVSHVSHLDPVVLSVLLKRPVSWMAREEFYRHRTWAGFLDRIGAFPVNRQGPALPGVREALARLRSGEVVGIFPEGEIMGGRNSVVHGGPIRRGVALLAARAGVPVVPVVVSGTQRLNSPRPWLPLKLGRLWVMAGAPLTAPADGSGRAGRDAFAKQLEQAFVKLYGELRHRFPEPESIIP